MNRLNWLLHQQVERIGWHGLLGAGLLLAGAVLAAVVVPARTARIEALQREYRALRSSMAHTAGRAAPTTRAEQLRSFYEYFPQMPMLADALERVYAAAAGSGVELEAAEYRLIEERDSRLVRYQLILPLRSSYAQARRFIAQVLNDVPAAGLDDIAFRRDSIGSTTLDVRIRLTIHMRRAQ